MPITLVKAYAVMLPRLEAEEQLARISAGALAFGSGDKAHRREAIRDLERRARGPGKRAASGSGVAASRRHHHAAEAQHCGEGSES